MIQIRRTRPAVQDGAVSVVEVLIVAVVLFVLAAVVFPSFVSH